MKRIYALAGLLLLLVAQSAIATEQAGVSVTAPSPAPSGNAVVFSADYQGPTNLWIASLDGKAVRQLTFGDDLEADPAWSPDGRVIAYAARRNEVFDLWTVNADGSNPRQLTRASRNNMQPAWSPDGTKIAFVSDRAGTNDIWVMNADGSGLLRLTTLPGQENHPSFSPLGDEVVFSETIRGQATLMAVRTVGGATRTLTTGQSNDWNPNWSRYGIVFSSNRGGDHWKIWTVKADGTGLAQLGDTAALAPAWMPNGQIVFADEWPGTSALSAVSVLNPATGSKRVVSNVAGYQTGIDIRPGKLPNKVNPISRGTIAVAVLSRPKAIFSDGRFDAPAMVDKSTLTFGATGNEKSLTRCSGRNRDVNFDGLADLTCRFRIGQTGIKSGDTTAILRFSDVNGIPYEGRDAIVSEISTVEDSDDVDRGED